MNLEMEPLKFIYVTGGRAIRQSLSLCEVYNPRSNTWHSIASMHSKRYDHALIPIGKNMYAFGGHNDDQGILPLVEFYDPTKDTWTQTTPMPHGRCAHDGNYARDDNGTCLPIRSFWYTFADNASNLSFILAVCSIDGSIFICGGRDEDDQYINTVEQFDPSTGVYKTRPAMNRKRCGLRMAAIGSCIYAIGGSNLDGATDSMERFDLREGKWSPAPSMNKLRTEFGATVLNGYIYCTGSVIDMEKSGERFDVHRNVWEPIPDMLDQRWGHELVAVDGCLYTIGGRAMTSIEKFDPGSNQWIEVAPMKQRRHLPGASVLDGFDIK